MTPARRHLIAAAAGAALIPAFVAGPAWAQRTPLEFRVGMFQPDREKNDATYRPLAARLAQRLARPVELRTVISWEGLAKSLANGETDIALMGPWGYVLANHFADAQVVSTILYEGKPEYVAMIVTHPDSGLNSVQDLVRPQGRTRAFAFGDKGSTSGYLIPLYMFQQRGIDPEKHFARVLCTKHQAIQTQVTAGLLDAGADDNRNRSAIDLELLPTLATRVLGMARGRIQWDLPLHAVNDGLLQALCDVQPDPDAPTTSAAPAVAARFDPFPHCTRSAA